MHSMDLCHFWANQFGTIGKYLGEILNGNVYFKFGPIWIRLKVSNEDTVYVDLLSHWMFFNLIIDFRIYRMLLNGKIKRSIVI